MHLCDQTLSYVLFVAEAPLGERDLGLPVAFERYASSNFQIVALSVTSRRRYASTVAETDHGGVSRRFHDSTHLAEIDR